MPIFAPWQISAHLPSSSPPPSLAQLRSILLIACWMAMTFVGLCVTGFIENDMLKEGNPARLTNGMDYLGNICGVTDYNITATGENTKDLSKAFYLPNGGE